jgi:hypothetical protein
MATQILSSGLYHLVSVKSVSVYMLLVDRHRREQGLISTSATQVTPISGEGAGNNAGTTWGEKSPGDCILLLSFALSTFHKIKDRSRAHSPVVAAEIASPAPRNHIAVQQKKPPQLRETVPAPTARVRVSRAADDIPA